MNDMVRVAQKVKATYLQNMVVLTDLEKQTAKRADTSKVTHLLKQGLELVQPRLSAWHKRFVIIDDKDWKHASKEYTHEGNVTELQSWVGFQVDVEQMGRIAQKLQTAHEAIQGM